MARDGGRPSRSATMEMVVMVIDANDHAPRFDKSEYTFDVVENVADGTVIGLVSATDSDDGNYAVVSYSFTRNTQVRHVTLLRHWDSDILCFAIAITYYY